MNALDAYRDGRISGLIFDRVRELAGKAAGLLGRPPLFMEVCGTHTVAVSRMGLRQLLGGLVELRSGPGCPVCVTGSRDIDRMIYLSGIEGITVLTFGDMIRVPGSRSRTLEKSRAGGSRVKMVYSPFQGVEMAASDPGHNYVMLGVGFETTAPVVAACLKEAAARGLKNYFLYSAHKVVPPVLHALLGDPEIKIDGLILPGHVAAITGRRALEFVSSRYGVPAVVAGFDPVDVLGAVHDLLVQVISGQAFTHNGYTRVVSENGNLAAGELLEELFEKQDSSWRGFGVIRESGLSLKGPWRDFDAAVKYSLPGGAEGGQKGCRCGDLLRGKILPTGCSLFGSACRPSHPVGPCMVSSEGACAAFFQFRQHTEGQEI